MVFILLFVCEFIKGVNDIIVNSQLSIINCPPSIVN